MNGPDFEEFERELASLKPGRLPEDFSAETVRKLVRAQPEAGPLEHIRSTIACVPGWLRWAIPAAAAIMLVALLPLYRAAARSKSGQNIVVAQKAVSSTRSVSILKPDAILISQELVGNFEAVTRLPDGAPVRFRCQEWVDEVQLRDPARGVWVERRKPRLEIIPVGYEVY